MLTLPCRQTTGQDDLDSRSERPISGDKLEAGLGSQSGRLWDIVWMLRFAIQRCAAGADRVPVALYVRNSDAEPAKLVKLIAACGPLDIDDPQPAITVMMPDED